MALPKSIQPLHAQALPIFSILLQLRYGFLQAIWIVCWHVLYPKAFVQVPSISPGRV
jgi:hypothetical protein